MRATLRLLVAIFTVATFSPLARAGMPVPGFVDTLVDGSVSAPTALAFLPDGRLLIAEKDGALELNDGVGTTTLLTLGVCSDSEMGLLGLAVDPDFAQNGFIYVYRTDDSGGCSSAAGRFNQVVRVTMAPDGTVSAGSLVVLLSGIRTDNGNHDGGALRVGPDGKLYVGVGDSGLGDNQGGPGSSTNPYAQDLSELNGKVLRLNLDGSVPTDNPFFGQAGARGEIFASGFRNPFRFNFDPQTGALWLGDVGDLTIEELDIVIAGANYSWPYCEATSPTGCAHFGDVAPIFTYPHSGGSSLGDCLIGGSFATAGFGGLDGDYFFADCEAGRIYHATVNGTRDDVAGTPTIFVSGIGTPADVIFGPDGALYYADVSGGEVRRVAPAPNGGSQLLAGQTLALKDDPAATRRRLGVQSMHDATLALGGPADDPTVAGGSLRVVGGTFDETFALPAGNWLPISKPADRRGFRYKDAFTAAGPVASAQVRAGKLVKATAKGAALGYSLASDPSPIDVVLTIGTRQYCLRFGGTEKFKPGKRLTARNAPVSPGCP